MRGLADLPRRRPWTFATAVVLIHLALLLPALRPHQFDVSTLVVAGDKFVHLSTGLRIVVRPNSAGYDGQFYYGIALDPFSPQSRVNGVAFDHPAWRWQRILYPILSYAVALGQPPVIPAALLATNLASLAALALLASRCLIQDGRKLSPAFIFMLWPGWLVTLTHDTTELMACALLFASIIAYLHRRYRYFAVFGAAATMTRETASLMIIGIAVAAIPAVFRAGKTPRGLGRLLAVSIAARPALYAGIALIPFLVWHVWLAVHFSDESQAAPVHANLGFPFVGIFQRLSNASGNLVNPDRLAAKIRLTNAYAAATVIFVIAFSAHVARAIPAVWRSGDDRFAVALGWLAMAALISCLSARGPWVDPTAIFRANSECWIVGFLLLTLAGQQLPKLLSLSILPLAAMNWLTCITQLR